MDEEREAAARLMAKVKDFTAELDANERRLFAMLLAPGIARAYTSEDDTTGFGFTRWSPESLPAALAEAVREAALRDLDLDQ